ncbi:hypothetical protein FKM82_015905 [Ascaphus truei]
MGPPSAKKTKHDVPQHEPSAPTPAPSECLFVDSSFPWDEALQVEGVEWRRPKEICAKPQFIIDGATRMDVCQGNLSNCWFLSAVACLSLYPQLLEQVVPVDQDFGEGYNGRFRFRFWQYGQWVEVLVDDLLPTVRTQDKEKGGEGSAPYNLLFMHSQERDEFWSSLLEKAYAKLKGGYAALQLGFAGEALVDMTGGVVQSCDSGGPSLELWRNLSHLLQRGALICCGNTQGDLETRNSMGILCHHMYSVTGTSEIQTLEGSVCLLRVRNPWGHTEWAGPWRDGGTEWQSVMDAHKSEVVILEDGEFWMAVEDFQNNFQLLETCHLGPQSLSRVGRAARPWECVTYEGRWVKGLSAGGSIACIDHYWMNPQFSLTLLEDDDPFDSSQTCSFIVAVMLKHQRLQRAGDTHVACHIFQGDEAHAYLFQEVLRRSRPLLSSELCTNHREVVMCANLLPGHYVIIPSLERVSDEGDFLLRVFTEKGSSARPMDNAAPCGKILLLSVCPSESQCFSKFMQFADQDSRVGADGLQKILSSLLSEFVPPMKRFTLECCHCLLAAVDTSAVGSLCWEQFQGLWRDISAGTRIYCELKRKEADGLGKEQLVPALQAAGLQVNDFLVRLARLRFADANGFLSHPDFICCLLKLQSGIGKFQTADPTGSGTVTLNYQQWLQLTIYN